MEVSCSSYIPHTPLGSLSETSFTCNPVYTCDNPEPFGSDSLQEVRWWKFFSESNLTQFLVSTDKDGFNQYRLTEEVPYVPYIRLIDDRVTLNTRINISGNQLNVFGSNLGVEALGYYVPTLVFNNSGGDIIRNGQPFIVYST